jgi:hypothetical protein
MKPHLILAALALTERRLAGMREIADLLGERPS